MPAVVDQELCTACRSCEETCPNGSIVVKNGEVAEVNPAECIECSACVDVCTTHAITLQD